MLSKNIKKKLIEISKKYDLKLFILFGSRAKGTSKKNSDWDFAYFPSKKINYLELYSKIKEIINGNIDLVDLSSDIDPYLKYNILKRALLIYEKERGFFDEMFSNSTVEYINFKPYLILEEEIINQKIKSL